MPAFPTDATTTHQHDFALVRSGGVATYLRDEVLHDSERELDALGYARANLDASGWVSERQLHEDLASTLNFPDYYGHNLNALADCLHDVACGEYGWDSDRTGLAVTIQAFGPFARQDPELAHAVVDLLTGASREAMLFGHRLVWLLHVDDPDFRMKPVGALAVGWNGREWLDAKRRKVPLLEQLVSGVLYSHEHVERPPVTRRVDESLNEVLRLVCQGDRFGRPVRKGVVVGVLVWLMPRVRCLGEEPVASLF